MTLMAAQTPFGLFDDEPEKLCKQCGECWPATEEFFLRDAKTGHLHSPCKACMADHREFHNRSALCCVPGCDAPRHVSRSGFHTHARCTRHQQEYNRMLYRRRKAASHV